MRASVILSALVAGLVGFGGSVAIVLAAADAVGATPAQTRGWISVLCLSMMVTTAWLSLRHRIPVITAWSTPGAALVATTTGTTAAEAAGAFLLCGGLLVLTAALRPLGRAVEAIPRDIAAAILAGVLFSFVLGLVTDAVAAPMLGAPLVLIFFVLRLFSPAWAVLAVLGAGLALAFGLGLAQPMGGFAAPVLAPIVPEFRPAVLIGLGLPLYLVTMASQNLPGFAVLTASGYAPPARAIVATTGLASAASALFGAPPTSLAAITASICTGPDAHPDPAKRWLTGPVYALTYGVLAVFGASLVALLTAMPPALIGIVAGAALLAPFVGAARLAFAGADPAPAATAFAVTASGVTALGIGAAFWGLVAGLAMTGAARLRAR